MIFQKVTSRGLLVIIFAAFAGVIPVNGQSDSVSTIYPNRMKTVIFGSAAVYTAGMVGLSQLWYKDFSQQSFHFFDDSKEWKQIDKVGHFYSAFHLSYGGSEILKWTGLAPKKSDRISSILGFAVLSSIEIFDGFSEGYGASVSDVGANALGAAFYLGQRFVWDEVRIYPKFSFHQTPYASLRPELLGRNLSQQLVKDYNGQTYWLSVDIDRFGRFPKWINLALGYGAEEMISAKGQSADYTPFRQYYLAIDFDLTSIHTESGFLNSLIFLANMVKLPAPTLAFSNQGITFRPLYF